MTKITSWNLLRDAVVVAGVAVLTVQALRRYCGDRYLVPSDSMQPVLYGDPLDGDVVFVDKLTSAAGRRRGDLVVVDNPKLAGHQLVKRIAASGDDRLCWIDILKGDIWLGENAQQMRREVKEPRDGLARSVTWAEAGARGSSEELLDLAAATPTAGGGWSLPPMANDVASVRAMFGEARHRSRHRAGGARVLPRGAVGTSRSVDASFVDMCGERSLGGEDVPVIDCGVELAVDGEFDALLLTIDSTDFATTFAWRPAQDRLTVWVDGRVVADQRDMLGRSWSGYAAYGRLDGRDFLMLDQDHEYALETPAARVLPRPRTWLHVGVVGSAPVELGALRVFRDVYAYRDPVASVGQERPWPKFVRPGHWFLLGDNAFDSRDSRHFGDVSTDRFLGVPAYVIGPWARARSLSR